MEFTKGQRVQTHPATDAWMQGDRYGEVVTVGRMYVHVALDRSGRTRRFLPGNLIGADDTWPSVHEWAASSSEGDPYRLND